MSDATRIHFTNGATIDVAIPYEALTRAFRGEYRADELQDSRWTSSGSLLTIETTTVDGQPVVVNGQSIAWIEAAP